jgi:hypothetical protein
MKPDVAKVNERWKKGCLLAFLGVVWVFHLVAAVWFVAHSEPTEAEVLRRKEWLLPGKHRGWAKLEVAYLDAQGKPTTGSIEWRVTPAPAGSKIQIWRAESGLIEAGPASWAETFFVETLFGYLALFIGSLIGAVILYGKLKDRLKRRLARKT